MTPTKPFYVYILVDPLEDRPIYVGKGRGKRYACHSREAKRGCECRKCCAIREVWGAGREIRVDFVFETDSEHEALNREKAIILRIGPKNLENVVGGRASGYTYSAEDQAKKRR